MATSAARAAVPDGFVVERISVTLVGRCPRCRDVLLIRRRAARSFLTITVI